MLVNGHQPPATSPLLLPLPPVPPPVPFLCLLLHLRATSQVV